MKQVLFVGDINVDLILGGLESLPLPDREITCRTFEVTLGSSAVICACNYAVLGGDAAVLGLAGQDDYGDFMIRGMNELGVDTRLVRRTDQARTGVTVNLIHLQQRTQVTYPGAIREFQGSDIDQSLLAGFRHVHFSGPYQQTRFRPEIGRLLQLASQAGVTTSLDPQWDQSERWEGLDTWLPDLTYFFVNEAEAESITACTGAEEACRQLAVRTACPLVKAGARGAFFAGRGGVVHVAACSVPIIDTTGAGDAFAAGLLYSVLEKHRPLHEAVCFANATAALSCRYPGGVAARSSFQTVIEFMAVNEQTNKRVNEQTREEKDQRDE